MSVKSLISDELIIIVQLSILNKLENTIYSYLQNLFYLNVFQRLEIDYLIIFIKKNQYNKSIGTYTS